MIANALEAAVVGRLYGMTMEEIAASIGKAKALPGRSNIIETEKCLIIDDCYNANGASMHAAIDLLKTANGRKVAILGDMYELGEKSDDIHREIGKYAVSQGTEVLICVGENSKNMYEAAMNELICEMQEIYYFENLEALFIRLGDIVCEGDSILVKASHGMQFSKVVDFLKTFK